MPLASTSSVSAPLRFALLITFILLLLLGHVSEPPWKYSAYEVFGLDLYSLFLVTCSYPVIPRDFVVRHAYLSGLVTLPITFVTIAAWLMSFVTFCILFSAHKTLENLWDSAKSILQVVRENPFHTLTGKQLKSTLPAVTFILLATYIGLGITVYYLMSQLRTIPNVYNASHQQDNRPLSLLIITTTAGLCSSIALTPNMFILLTRYCQRNLHCASSRISKVCNKLYVNSDLNMPIIYPFTVFVFFVMDQIMITINISLLMTRKRFRRSNVFPLVCSIGLQLALGMSDILALWRRSPEELLEMFKSAYGRTAYRSNEFFEHYCARVIVGVITIAFLCLTRNS